MSSPRMAMVDRGSPESRPGDLLGRGLWCRWCRWSWHNRRHAQRTDSRLSSIERDVCRGWSWCDRTWCGHSRLVTASASASVSCRYFRGRQNPDWYCRKRRNWRYCRHNRQSSGGHVIAIGLGRYFVVERLPVFVGWIGFGEQGFDFSGDFRLVFNEELQQSESKSDRLRRHNFLWFGSMEVWWK